MIPFGNVEEFITLHGTGLVATESCFITVSGPAGEFVLEPSAMSDSQIIFYAPEVVLLTEGTYTVTVAFKNLEEPVQDLGPFTFTVETVEIVGPPIIEYPEFLLAEAENSEGAHVDFEVSAVSQSGDAVDIDCTSDPGDLFPIGITPVQCTATDVNGTSFAEFEVRVADFTPPVLTLPDDFESDSPVVTYTVSATDNLDGTVAVKCNHPSGSTFPTGIVTVFCEAYDSALNYASGTFVVTVHGGAPVLNLPEDIFVEATSPTGAVVHYTVTATENGVVTCNPASGSFFPMGPTTVNCTATNAAGSTSGSFVVEVIDGAGPVLTLPDDIVAEATGPDGAVVTYVASATDSVDGDVPVTCDPVSGSTFPLGTTTVTCTASDLQGHEETGSFTITVRDTTAPQILSITATPDTIWPPDHKMIPVLIEVRAFDAVDPTPVSTIVSVSSNQPVNGTGDGDTAPDWDIVGPLALKLRAERAGSQDRVYTITIETTDDSGNSTLSTVTVKVVQSSRRRSVR